MIYYLNSEQDFPYPLKKLKGKVNITRGTIVFENIISEYLDRRITMNGQVTETPEDLPELSLEEAPVLEEQSLEEIEVPLSEEITIDEDYKP